MITEVVKFPAEREQARPTTGSAGIQSQIPGQAATVSGLAGATGGIKGGNMVETDVK